ncbi:DUF1036 domain-containing protein [Arenicella xantha]|uniref:Uncharacterized protein DUF1036 n=1 Tax=Arenicella xantha TaxID=644221 RepID=A0A395JMD9_9GAMM|nr:DUF1036 domain-containing protein [Arenicella xantha]RBP52627.1 uncharacterized protein DUF1036 [Arenicella xantha]
MRGLAYYLIILCGLWSTCSQARLELCNRTDLVLMVAVGYDTTDDRTVSEGWWKVYPGNCEVPVDVALLKGSYYLHAESNPRSTMPDDAFSWGEEKPLCVQLADFRIPDGNQCSADQIAIQFNQVDKNWRNSNKIDIFYAKRSYADRFETQVAGIQRLLSMLGYDVGDEFGRLNENTVAALNQIGQSKGVFGLNFDQLFPVLEQLIAHKHKLDN